jgi:hypothetical protein
MGASRAAHYSVVQHVAEALDLSVAADPRAAPLLSKRGRRGAGRRVTRDAVSRRERYGLCVCLVRLCRFMCCLGFCTFVPWQRVLSVPSF